MTRSRFTARRLLLAWGLCALSALVGVVAVGAQAPAAAWNGTPSPVEIGDYVRKVPPSTVVKTGGRLNPYIRAGNLMMAGLQLADTLFGLPDEAGDPTKTEVDPTTGELTLSGQRGNCVYQATAAVDRHARIRMVGTGCGAGGTSAGVRFFCSINPGVANETVLLSLNTIISNGTATSWGGSRDCGEGSTLSRFEIGVQNFWTSGGLRTGTGTGYPTGEHEATTTVQCRKPDGSIVEISDTRTGHPMEVTVPSCADRVGPGAIPVEIIQDSGRAGGSKTRDIGVQVTPNLFTDYPDCFANGALQCVVTIWVNGRPCNASRSVCWDWGETLARDPDAQIQCRFGNYVIGIGECEELKTSYKPNTKTQILTGTKPDGGPKVGPKPDPETPGNPQPSAPPTAGPNPESPPVDPGPETDPDSRSCYADAWSFNPVDWVYVPVKCAFLWAFKPKTSLKTRVDIVVNTANGKAPFSWFSGLAGLPAFVPGGSCPNWRIKVADLNENVVCNSSFTAAIRGARPVLLGFMGALALWPLIRSTAYAAVPIIKPNPTVLR